MKATVKVDLSDIIDACTSDGLEGFLDLLEEEVGASIGRGFGGLILTDIRYKAVGVEKDGTIVMEVEGDEYTE